MDYIEFVVKYGGKLEDVKSRCGSIKAFVRRAEDFPSLVAQEGLVAALTFYYSKAEGRPVKPEDIREVKEEKADLKQASRGQESEGVGCGEVTSEGEGYSLYLNFLLEVLRTFGGLKCESPLECIREVRRNEFVLTRLILPILVEMKKVAHIIEGE